MDNKVEVTETTVEATMLDQVLVTVLGAIAGLVAGKLVERGYYSTKARVLIKRSATN